MKTLAQDKLNIDFAYEWLQKAIKKDWKAVKGPIKWVGEEGFNTCVARLSGKHGITNARALCGALKREARKRGELAPKHMGRKEKAKYLKGKKK